jgi:hypothetical protein
MNDIAIAPANAASPCGNEAVLSASLDLECGVNYSIVAYLDADGMPTAGLFVNNAAPTDRGTSRLIVAHTAAAPAVDISVRRDGPDSPGIVVEDFFNGDQAEADVRPGEWNVAIFPAGEETAVFGPVTVELKPYTAYLIYAVGSLDYETFTLLSQPIGGLKPMKVLGASDSGAAQSLRGAKQGR